MLVTFQFHLVYMQLDEHNMRVLQVRADLNKAKLMKQELKCGCSI